MASATGVEPRPSMDSYDRQRPDTLGAVEVEGDTPQWRSYEVECIVDKRMRTDHSKQDLQYLLHWKGFDSEDDEWQSLNQLGNCMELVEEYEARTASKEASSWTTGTKLTTRRVSQRVRRTPSTLSERKLHSAVGLLAKSSRKSHQDPSSTLSQFSSQGPSFTVSVDPKVFTAPRSTTATTTDQHPSSGIPTRRSTRPQRA